MQPQTGQNDGSATENGDEAAFFLRGCVRGVDIINYVRESRERIGALASSVEGQNARVVKG